MSNSLLGRWCRIGVLLAVMATFSGIARASTVPAGFTETKVASLAGLFPTAMGFAPDGRLFICDKGGKLVVVKNGVLLSTPFLTLTVETSGERGLLGIAFDPAFNSNHYIYVYYTVPVAPIHNRISRFTASGDVVAPGSEFILMDLDPLNSTIHNSGAMHFGQDGKLYVAVGENFVQANAQSLNTVLGKMLRLNADGSIPTDNPFYNSTTGNNRAIYALGFRNPFTFSVQPGTGKIFANDVGQDSWEEIDDVQAGKNYGWSACEGACSPTNPNYTDPVFAYGHGDGETMGCAITGGTFYNPSIANFPTSYTGKYFFADYCNNWIRLLDPSTKTATTFATGIVANPVDLELAPDGSLYYLTTGAPSVYKISYSTDCSPFIGTQPANQTVAIGQSATFSVAVFGGQPFTYQWQRNGANIQGANSDSYTINNVSLTDNNAKFGCLITNACGSSLSNSGTLTVLNDHAPIAIINTPASGAKYNAGDTISYSGSYTDSDAADAALPASAYTWEVRFQHENHFHPLVAPYSGATGGTFTIPTTGEVSNDVWYRVILTITDSSGISHTTYRDITPNSVQVTVASNPSGLQVVVNGQPQTTPYVQPSVVNISQTLGVVSPQTLNGVTYVFSSWSDGGAASHTIATPNTNTTYTANFRRSFPTMKIGIYRPSKQTFYLRNSNSSGIADLQIPYGAAGDLPLVGDWDGNGTWTIGVYRPSTHWFFLRNSNTPGVADIQIQYGITGDIPIVGDWDGNGTWTIGVYRPSTATFMLRNSNTPGAPDLSFTYGGLNEKPIVGDWDGNHSVTIGLARSATYFLRNSNTSGVADLMFTYGAASDTPIIGDWDGNGTATVSIYRNATFYLHNSNSSGVADLMFTYGAAGDIPLAGSWDGR